MSDTTSYWIDSGSVPRNRKLSANVKVDAIVIGGGITGITAAYLLKKAGKTVALVERGRCAHLDTGNTTAHLTCVTDLRLHEMSATFGRDVARAMWDAGTAAIDQIVALIRAEDMACDFRWVPGFLHAKPGSERTERSFGDLSREAETAQDLGIPAEYFDAVPFFGVPGVKFPHQAIFHPLKYLGALVRGIPGGGSHVFEHTEAGEIQADPLTVHAGKFKITGRHLVLATHMPLMGNTNLLRAALFQSKLALYTSYALGAKIVAGRAPEACYWDTADPYHYLRVERRHDHDYAIFGGEDHKTGQGDPAAAYRRLEQTFLGLFPDAAIDHRWSGQLVETSDGLPFIGETAENQFAATGFSGNGMTFGTLGAMMAVDVVLKKRNPWSGLFDVNRAGLRAGAWDYLKENKDYPFYLLRDWIAGAQGSSLGELKRNEGKILNLDGKKVAAHRDARGHVSLCSPVCTHLKCIVAWNPAEQTWDCPCHGSRFKPTGEVISGPAEESLEKISREVLAT